MHIVINLCNTLWLNIDSKPISTSYLVHQNFWWKCGKFLWTFLNICAAFYMWWNDEQCCEREQKKPGEANLQKKTLPKNLIRQKLQYNSWPVLLKVPWYSSKKWFPKNGHCLNFKSIFSYVFWAIILKNSG